VPRQGRRADDRRQRDRGTRGYRPDRRETR
jgi:hypothetical protein